jgi:competence protein ComGF
MLYISLSRQMILIKKYREARIKPSSLQTKATILPIKLLTTLCHIEKINICIYIIFNVGKFDEELRLGLPIVSLLT